ncbi:DUF7504 family protein [Halobaculum sp. EA56]|uniref:DUF7504 family protein n=1 Tax=Halobaculum sp. EA56 TaxID=3421648 RepID=UPI003EB6EDFC
MELPPPGELSSPIAEVRNRATAVLVCAPVLDRGERCVCRSLLVDEGEEAWYARLSFRRSVSDQLSEFRRYGHVLPEGAIFVQVRGGIERVRDPADRVPDDLSVVVRTVTDPGSISRLGVALTDLERTHTNEGDRLHVCVDSLTALLQYAELEQVVQFVQVANEFTRATGGDIHYHLDPNAHDTETVATIRHLVDTVVHVDESGHVDIQ